MADKDPVMKSLSTFALNVPMTRLSLVSDSMAKPLSAFKHFFAVSVVYCSRRKVFLRALAPNFDVVDRRRAIAPWDQGARKKNIVHNLPT